MKHYIQSSEERMKPATPKMTVLQSPVGLRSIVTFLAAFFIVVSTFSLLFERGQQEAEVQMAVERRNQEMQLKHHDQQLRGQEEVQVKVVAAAEHHDQQLRGSEAGVKVAAAEHHDQQLRGSEAGVKVAAAEHNDKQLRGQEEEVQVKVVAAAEHLHDQQLRGSEAGVKVAAAEHHDQQLRGQEAEAEAEVQRTAELHEDSGEEECNWSTGRWVYDNASRPLYSGPNCSFIFPEVACDQYGRKDVMYQHWRWQPHGCDLPRFNATKLLGKLRNKRLIFVGDSLNRNQWVSMVCMVEASIPDDSLKMRIFNGSLISFKALEYNATIDFYWSPLLLESNSDNPIIHRVEYRIIRADRIEKHASVWRDANIIVFNSYLWWMKHKEDMRMKVMYGSFEDGDAKLDKVEMIDGFDIAIKKLTEWLRENIDKNKTRIFFAGSSPTHSWASNWGGIDCNKCLNETEPIYKIGYKAATTDYSLMAKAKSHFATLEKKGIHVQILNITELSDYRKDGHPSVYRKHYVPLTKEQIANPASYADCTHWCLPGIPDVWNEFLYGYLTHK